VGVFGHSTGGGAAVEVCASDPRCKAGLAMDAWMVPYAPDVAQNGLRVPFFFFQSENWPNSANARLLPGVYAQAQAPAWRLTIAGTRHFDFSDIALLTPLAAPLGIKGPIDGRYDLQLINAYSLAFFDAMLRGQSPSALLQGPSPAYPEITYERK